MWVNNIWEIGGLNIIKIIIKLDCFYLFIIIFNVVLLCIWMVEYYVCEVVKIDVKVLVNLFFELDNLENIVFVYVFFDYIFFC